MITFLAFGVMAYLVVCWIVPLASALELRRPPWWCAMVAHLSVVAVIALCWAITWLMT